VPLFKGIFNSGITMVERDTWESRENLQNAGDLLREFEEEYKKDHRKVRRLL